MGDAAKVPAGVWAIDGIIAFLGYTSEENTDWSAVINPDRVDVRRMAIHTAWVAWESYFVPPSDDWGDIIRPLGIGEI